MVFNPKKKKDKGIRELLKFRWAMGHLITIVGSELKT